MYDQNITKSESKSVLLIARLTGKGKYVKTIERNKSNQK